MSTLTFGAPGDAPGTRPAPESRGGRIGVTLRWLGGAFMHGHGAANGPDTPREGRGRSRIFMLKPVTYSVMHLMVAVMVAYALTRDWRIALGVGIVEPIVQTFAYTLHEHAWSKVKR